MDEPVKLFYQERGGSHSGSSLVLLHGYPLDHTIWDAVVPLLENQVHVITPDLRGHGRSPAPDGVYTMRLLARDVAALLDELGLEKVVLGGHSMGGYAALAFAQAYPQRLQALALIASQAAADPPDRRQGRYETAAQVARQGMVVVADAMAPRLTTIPSQIEPLRRLILANPPQGAIGVLKGMAERPDLTDFLSELDLPVLILTGDQDAFVPLKRSQTLAARLRHGRLVVVPGAGHLPMLESPRLVAEALSPFLTR
jgi:3-oxoadipate enol-lactonase